MARSPDVIFFGGGIAGLWAFHCLKRMGYDVLLLERDSLGSGQTIASQGIIHSGLKFSLAGKVNALARSISAMPELWRDALRGSGSVDLSNARTSAKSQFLMIPHGFMGGLVKILAQKALGGNVRDIPKAEWPDTMKQSGFGGSLIFMDEPVVDVPSVLRALAQPYQDSIRKISATESLLPFEFLKTHDIAPKKIIFTAADSNQTIATHAGHEKGLQTQARPLLQGMMKPAPFPLYAHLVGKTDKPVATITTHRTQDGTLVWYLGAGVAERAKDSDPAEVIAAAQKAFADYMPALDFSQVEWATLAIDRIEGKSNTDGWMPDTPTLHRVGNILYAWPTKLTFAPLLSDMIVRELEKDGLKPSGVTSDFSFLPPVDVAQTPWDKAVWKK